MSTELLSTLAQLIISLGLTLWVYNVLNRIIQELRARVLELEAQIRELKASENRWYKKYNNLLSIFNKTVCKDDCPLKKEIVEYLAKDGERK
jgi:predicted transcriptional regulator